MNSLELTISVDELPDYNENGSKQTDVSYYMIINADVDVHARDIVSISLFDTALSKDVDFHKLTEKDQDIVRSRVLDFIENNITFLLDSLKEYEQDQDIDHYRDSRGDR